MSSDKKTPSIKIPLSCLVEYASSGKSRPPDALLRPYKFKKQGEGFARSSYYQKAITAIRKYHQSGNNAKVLPAALAEMEKIADTTQKNWERIKMQKNISAIDAYERIYGARKFKVEPNHKLPFQVGPVVVSPQPDIWVQEHGIPVLVKIGIAKKNSSYVDLLLTVLRKAAIKNGYRVRAKNVVYLDVSKGKELICSTGLSHFNRILNKAAQEIAETWPDVEEKGAKK